MTQPMEQERAQRLMAMGQMAASLAHEIRNPLGSMELFCTLLKKDLEGQPQLLQTAEQIHLGIRTLERIISNCLQFARDVVPHKKTLKEVAPVLEEALTYVRGRAEELKVEIVLETSGEGPVCADPYLLNQVLLNVLLNAIEASGNGGRVTLRSEITATEWTLTVTDTGPGISAEAKRQIFDPFFTTKQGGTGLGLTIVHSIMQGHGGNIDLESESGCGTRAVLRFPLSSADTKTYPVRKENASGASA